MQLKINMIKVKKKNSDLERKSLTLNFLRFSFLNLTFVFGLVFLQIRFSQ